MTSRWIVFENLQKDLLRIIIIAESICVDQDLPKRMLSSLLRLCFSLVHWIVLSRRLELVHNHKHVVFDV